MQEAHRHHTSEYCGDRSSLPPGAILIECDSYTATVSEGGKILLTIEGAKPSKELPPQNNYLTIRQAAARLNVSVRTVRRAMEDRRDPIPHDRIERWPRFAERAILEWADRRGNPVARRVRERFNRPVSLFGGRR